MYPYALILRLRISHSNYIHSLQMQQACTYSHSTPWTRVVQDVMSVRRSSFIVFTIKLVNFLEWSRKNCSMQLRGKTLPVMHSAWPSYLYRVYTVLGVRKSGGQRPPALLPYTTERSLRPAENSMAYKTCGCSVLQ